MAGILNTDDFIGGLNQITGQIKYNNAVAQQNALDQRNWTRSMWETQAAFNAEEAAKNRQWQEYMSNTAHQREVRDLQAAGLNPILSAQGGNGAAVTSGATASATSGSGQQADSDQSGSMALVSLLGSLLQAQTNLQMADISARTQEAVAEKYTSMDQLLAQINQETAWRTAEINQETSKYAADQSLKGSNAIAGASVYAANKQYDTQKMIQDMQYEIAKLNNDTSLTKQEREQIWDEYIRQNYPSTDIAAISALVHDIFDKGGRTHSAISDVGSWLMDLFGLGDSGFGSSGGFSGSRG